MFFYVGLGRIPLGVLQFFKPKFVKSIGCVRNEFAQKDFTMRVERVDHQIKDLLNLGLKRSSFFCHTILMKFSGEITLAACARNFIRQAYP